MNRISRIDIRISPDEKKAFKAVAEYNGITLSELILNAARGRILSDEADIKANVAYWQDLYGGI